MNLKSRKDVSWCSFCLIETLHDGWTIFFLNLKRRQFSCKLLKVNSLLNFYRFRFLPRSAMPDEVMTKSEPAIWCNLLKFFQQWPGKELSFEGGILFRILAKVKPVNCFEMGLPYVWLFCVFTFVCWTLWGRNFPWSEKSYFYSIFW